MRSKLVVRSWLGKVRIFCFSKYISFGSAGRKPKKQGCHHGWKQTFV